MSKVTWRKLHSITLAFLLTCGLLMPGQAAAEPKNMQRDEWVHVLSLFAQEHAADLPDQDMEGADRQEQIAAMDSYYFDGEEDPSWQENPYRDEILYAAWRGWIPDELIASGSSEEEESESEDEYARLFGPEKELTKEFAAVTAARALSLVTDETAPIGTEDQGQLLFPREDAAAVEAGLFEKEDFFDGERILTDEEAQEVLDKASDYLEGLSEDPGEGSGSSNKGSGEPGTDTQDGDEDIVQKDKPEPAGPAEKKDRDETEQDEGDPLGVNGDLFGNPDMRFSYAVDKKAKEITLYAYDGEEPEVIIPAAADVKGKNYHISIEGQGLFREQPDSEEEGIRSVSFTAEDEKKVSVADCSLAYCFRDCIDLESVDLTGLDTSCVTDMQEMFAGAEVLREIDLSECGTDQLLSAEGMFEDCISLGVIDLGSWDTAQLRDMSRMFSGCASLKHIRLPEEMSSVENMSEMCANCESLQETGLKRRKLPALHTADSLFYGCSSLESADLRDARMPVLNNAESMFGDCRALEKTDFTGFFAPNLTKLEGAFMYCEALKEADFTGAELGCIETMKDMFTGCAALETVDLSAVKAESVRSMAHLCKECGSLKSYIGPEGDLSHLRNASYMFEECGQLTDASLGTSSSEDLQDIRKMFTGCKSLASADLSKWDLSHVQNISGIFRGCNALKDVHIQGGQSALDFSHLFADCSSLEEVDLSGLDTGNAGNLRGMFSGCSKLRELDLSGFDTKNVVDMSDMFDGCESLEILDLSSFDTTNVWDEGMSVGGKGSRLKTLIAPGVIGEDYICHVLNSDGEEILTVDYAVEPKTEIPVR